MYIVRFLHQTTTFDCNYLLPKMLYIVRFLHQTTTLLSLGYRPSPLYIVRFLHQTTTFLDGSQLSTCCISSVSYIKPQPVRPLPISMFVVYRPFPTSNHNISDYSYCTLPLYIVRFLHQTTTAALKVIFFCSCISSVSYIKPQPLGASFRKRTVVYRPFPTSNHNHQLNQLKQLRVVYRPFPTSNHNRLSVQAWQTLVVYRPFPTSNHN